MWNCKQIQRRCHWQLACSMSSLWQFSIARRGGTIVDHDHAKKSSHCHHPSVVLQKKVNGVKPEPMQQQITMSFEQLRSWTFNVFHPCSRKQCSCRSQSNEQRWQCWRHRSVVWVPWLQIDLLLHRLAHQPNDAIWTMQHPATLSTTYEQWTVGHCSTVVSCSWWGRFERPGPPVPGTAEHQPPRVAHHVLERECRISSCPADNDVTAPWDRRHHSTTSSVRIGIGRCTWHQTTDSALVHLPHLNPDWYYLFGTGLPRLSWKRGR